MNKNNPGSTCRFFCTLKTSEVWIKKPSWQQFLDPRSLGNFWPKVDQGLTFDVWYSATRYMKNLMGSKWCWLRGNVFNLFVSRTCLPWSSEFPCYFLCQTWQLPIGLTCKERMQSPMTRFEREMELEIFVWQFASFCETSMHSTCHFVRKHRQTNHSTWLPWSKSQHLLKQILHFGKQRGRPLSRRNPRLALLELVMSPPWCSSLFEYRWNT